jgi:hypothetical protein
MDDLAAVCNRMALAGMNRRGLEPIGQKYYLDGRPVEHMAVLEVRFPDGTWVRGIVDEDLHHQPWSGLQLRLDYHGKPIVVNVDTDDDHMEVRWAKTT